MTPYGRVRAATIQMVGFADQTAAIPDCFSQRRRRGGRSYGAYGLVALAGRSLAQRTRVLDGLSGLAGGAERRSAAFCGPQAGPGEVGLSGIPVAAVWV